MKEKWILAVDDNNEILAFLSAALSPEFHVHPCRSETEAKAAALEKTWCLILLDVSLPDGSGYELCNWFKQSEAFSEIPILFLTSRQKKEDLLMGFKLGAVDYIKKPFDPDELKARVKAHVERSSVAKTAAESSLRFEIPGLEIDLEQQRVVHKTDQGELQSLELTQTEFKILTLLARKPGQIVSRSALIMNVWSSHSHVSDRVIDNHVSSLRKKIAGSQSKSKLKCQIEAVYGRGYRINWP